MAMFLVESDSKSTPGSSREPSAGREIESLVPSAENAAKLPVSY